jgi:glycosyltransferase involved in cell wall biosynthesis
MTKDNAISLSIIIPTYNEENNVEHIYNNIKKVLHSAFMNLRLEVIFINDGSSDGTLDSLIKISVHDDVKYINFSKNFGHQQALRAGLHRAKGDAVISMDCDLQHPPEVIPQLVNKWIAGYEIVNTTRADTKQTSMFKSFTSKSFYSLMNFFSDIEIKQGSADFRLLDMKVVKVLNNINESDPFYRGLVSWVGFKQTSVDYIPQQRFSGETKYTIIKMIKFAVSGITSFSTKPLRFSMALGAMVSVLAFIYISYALIQNLVYKITIPGWTSVLVSILLLGGIQLIMIGILGEYLGKMFIETKNRPSYIVSSSSYTD